MMVEWISVKERLPKPGEMVLATCGRFVGEACLKENGHWLRYHGFAWLTAFGRPVTDWMPMPEPHKAGDTTAEECSDVGKVVISNLEKTTTDVDTPSPSAPTGAEP